MEISKETREALLADLSEQELQAELDKRANADKFGRTVYVSGYPDVSLLVRKDSSMVRMFLEEQSVSTIMNRYEAKCVRDALDAAIALIDD